jgi:sugar-specific transcriptional regulator TrmB
MTVSEEDLKIFFDLGLTGQQTKVYMALNKLGQAPITAIANAAQIARAEAYRAIPQLQKTGLVKKHLTKPVSFEAIAPSEGLTILLQQDAERHKTKQVQATNLLRKLKKNREDSIPNVDEYTVTFGRSTEEKEFLRTLRKLRISSDAIFEWKDFLGVFETYSDEYEDALRRGVQIRRIVDKPESLRVSQIVKKLKKHGSFEIRTASLIPRIFLDIFDKKVVAIITIPDSGLKEMKVLRSRTPGFVGLMQDYFELKWVSARKLAF